MTIYPAICAVIVSTTIGYTAGYFVGWLRPSGIERYMATGAVIGFVWASLEYVAPLFW
jgi:ABC-type dipeptide/oligopeptide/nickel transport system permease subunit